VPINFHPQPGTVLICDFDGYRVPEMIKIRPVVVISPRRRDGTALCTVVPLSSTAPAPQQPWHHRIAPDAYPGARGLMWAKCDMLSTVAHARLDRVKVKHRDGRRTYEAVRMGDEDMAAIMAGVRIALGLS
jgi:uncharacterized protein YifN (PemK superfamily)